MTPSEPYLGALSEGQGSYSVIVLHSQMTCRPISDVPPGVAGNLQEVIRYTLGWFK